MSILIKNVEMPTSCPCELLGIGYDLYCSFVGGIPARVKEYYECCQNGTRPSWCPLAPVPTPHGDLIDRDKLLSGDGVYLVSFQKSAIDTMKIIEAPTIIPADREEQT